MATSRSPLSAVNVNIDTARENVCRNSCSYNSNIISPRVQWRSQNLMRREDTKLGLNRNDCPKSFETGQVTPQTPRWLHSSPKLPPPGLPWTDPQTQLRESSLDPSDLPSQAASISDQSFYNNALDRQTDRVTILHSWILNC